MKNIASKNDLALFGAAPAFDAPVHVGRPNIGSQTQLHHLVDEMFERKWLGNHGPLLLEFGCVALAKLMALGVAHPNSPASTC